MTPKEKAKELFDKFYSITGPFTEAKQCALIAVDEVLKELDVETWGLEMYEAFDRQRYWQEVKKELEKI